jgi:gluconate 2-dehydrogenase gamma chain
MNDEPDEAASNSRRTFLGGVGATLGLATAAGKPATGMAQTQPAPVAPSAAPGFQSLSLDESAATEALVEHMWPADQVTAYSGVELGIATFIDRQLAGAFGGGDRLYAQGPFRKGRPQHGYQLPLTPEAWYKAGIAALNDYCTRIHGKSFDRLPASERETALLAASTGKANTPEFDLGVWFNELLYPLFLQGAFADPIYGGNAGKTAWKMLGYPGLPAVYNQDIVTYRGKRHPKSDAPKSIQDLS